MPAYTSTNRYGLLTPMHFFRGEIAMFAAIVTSLSTLLAEGNVSVGGGELPWFGWAGLGLLIVLIVAAGLIELLGVRYIPNNRVGIVEKLWSPKGSVSEGRIIALNGEAGFQADLLRGGYHFGLWRLMYRIHKVSLVTVPQGKIGYVYARDGRPLEPGQTLARVVSSNNFQDARAFLGEGASDEAAIGQRGRQRMILREGVYAINLALFVVITEDAVYRLNMQGEHELQTLVSWQKELRTIDGFSPIVIGALVPAELQEAEAATPGAAPRARSKVVGVPIPEQPLLVEPQAPTGPDNIGIVTVQDGPSLAPGEIIA